jgi:hypothetical protein
MRPVQQAGRGAKVLHPAQPLDRIFFFWFWMYVVTGLPLKFAQKPPFQMPSLIYIIIDLTNCTFQTSFKRPVAASSSSIKAAVLEFDC